MPLAVSYTALFYNTKKVKQVFVNNIAEIVKRLFNSYGMKPAFADETLPFALKKDTKSICTLAFFFQG